eukprot:scaffold171180_cov30-Tisochrysis_lutea.AAC.6
MALLENSRHFKDGMARQEWNEASRDVVGRSHGSEPNYSAFQALDRTAPYLNGEASAIGTPRVRALGKRKSSGGGLLASRSVESAS